MRNPAVIIAIAVLALAGVGVALLSSSPDVAPTTWQIENEQRIDLTTPDAAESGEGPELDQVDRIVAESGNGPVAEADENPWGGRRVNVTLRGRIVDRNAQPVQGAEVTMAMMPWVNRRGGQGIKVPDPAVTTRDGVFQFNGEVFPRIRLNLQIAKDGFAPALSDHPMEEAVENAIVDLGDIELLRGGTVVGRVVDESGVGIAAAEVTLQPEARNRMRWMRGGDNAQPTGTTGNDGSFRFENVPVGTLFANASASRYQEGRSGRTDVKDEEVASIPEIRLLDGYQVVGRVFSLETQAPVEGARIELRPTSRGVRGRFRAESEEDGTFLVDHLPASPMELNIRKEGFLPFEKQDIDPTVSVQIDARLNQGLKIQGIVKDGESGEPVTSYAIRAVRVGPLPDSEAGNVGALMGDLRAQMEAMRNGTADPEAARAMERRMRDAERRIAQLRQDAQSGRGGRGGRGPGGPFGIGGDSFRDEIPGNPGEPKAHAGGKFLLEGLQEGVYVLDVGSPDHQRVRTGEIELRQGAPVAPQSLILPRGLPVAGLVLTEDGDPIVGARVELRIVPPSTGDASGSPFGGNDRGGRGGRGMGNFAAAIFGGGDNSIRYLETRSGADGSFRFGSAPQDQDLTLRSRASGRSATSTDTFRAGSDSQSIEIVMNPLATLSGVVSGMRPDEVEDTRVYAVRIGGGASGGRPFQDATPAADGTYRFDDLQPGDYIVRASTGDNRRRVMGQFFGSIESGGLQADVVVVAGEEATFNLVLERGPEGRITGTVIINGQPASGATVRANQVNRDGGGGGIASFIRGGRTTARTDANGRYEITGMEGGEYNVTISAPSGDGGGRGGRGGRGGWGGGGSEIHRETVVLPANGSIRVDASVSAGSLKGTIRMADDSELPRRIGVLLLKGATVVPEDMRTWGRDNTIERVRVSDGSFSTEGLQVGGWLAVVNRQGAEAFTQQVVIRAGDNTVEIVLPKVEQPQEAGTGGGGF